MSTCEMIQRYDSFVVHWTALGVLVTYTYIAFRESKTLSMVYYLVP
jgi:hypothetical protein